MNRDWTPVSPVLLDDYSVEDLEKIPGTVWECLAKLGHCQVATERAILSGLNWGTLSEIFRIALTMLDPAARVEYAHATVALAHRHLDADDAVNAINELASALVAAEPASKEAINCAIELAKSLPNEPGADRDLALKYIAGHLAARRRILDDRPTPRVIELAIEAAHDIENWFDRARALAWIARVIGPHDTSTFFEVALSIQKEAATILELTRDAFPDERAELFATAAEVLIVVDTDHAARCLEQSVLAALATGGDSWA